MKKINRKDYYEVSGEIKDLCNINNNIKVNNDVIDINVNNNISEDTSRESDPELNSEVILLIVKRIEMF